MSFEMVSRLITNLEKKPMLEDTFNSRLPLTLTKKASKEEVAGWLQEEGYLLARDKLKGITGKELYSISKEDLRKMLGFAEAARLFSRLLKEKERLPAAEQTIKESDFQRFMRIRREDVDSRIPNNPVTSFSSPVIPPKPTRPMIREVFHEAEEPFKGKYAEKVKKHREKSSEKRFSKKVEIVSPKEVSGKQDRRSKYRKERESPESELSASEEDDKKLRRKHKKDKKDRKERKEREEGKGRKEKHKRSHKSKQSSESSSSVSDSDESSYAPPKSRHRTRRKERDRKKIQEKEKKKEEPVEPISPLPQQPYLADPLRPHMPPYTISPVPPMLNPHLHPQYPPPFPDRYTNQLMMQQAQIKRAEHERFAAEMRLRQLKSGFGAPGAMSFSPPMSYQNF